MEKSATKKWQVVVGMEVHVQPRTRSKMFCRCTNDPFCKNPNAHTCPVCMGLPGSLPVANKEAIKQIMLFGLALNCKIAEYSAFDRKSYFYPDLPKGYQISQYKDPFCTDGELKIGEKTIKINRIHLEEDAGKNFHPEGSDSTLVDLNRAGVPLIELVTEPDIDNAEDARKFCQELQLILRYLKISDADMEKGQMRCEANISLSPFGSKGKARLSGTKVEVKNLNSFKAVERSIEFEIKRQKKLLNRGEEVKAETRGWNENKQATVSQRSKEVASEYRYFPEPDLPPIFIEREEVEALKGELKELPAGFRKRLAEEYGVSGEAIDFLATNKEYGDYFEEVCSELLNWWEDTNSGGEQFPVELYQLAANYILTEIKKYFVKEKIDFKENKCTAENLAELVVMLKHNKINSSAGQTILIRMMEKGSDPSQIAEELDLLQISDEGALEKAIDRVLETQVTAFTDFKSGNEKVLQFLIGQVMKETKGKANPKSVEEIIRRRAQN